MKKVAIIIPARYDSSRLSGKPLLDIAGKPMIQHVVEAANKVPNVDTVIVATDDDRIMQCVKSFGGTVLMTSKSHASGTDRLVEVMQHYPADIYLNLQGDEPLVRASDLHMLILELEKLDRQVATLCHKIDADAARNANSVKVVMNNAHEALYFSRSIIPYPRVNESAIYYQHVGVYAYKKEALVAYSTLPRAMLEMAESLEQLRFLDAGIPIKVIEVEPTSAGVDTYDDLERVRAFFCGDGQSDAFSVCQHSLT